MRHRSLFSWLRRPSRRTRVLVGVLVAMQYPWSALAARANEPSAATAVASSPPLSAATTVLPTSTTPPVTANRTVPTVTPPPTRLTFSGLPTDAEIFRARIFSEALVPIGRATRPIENVRLAQALRTYAAARRPEDVAPITRFLDAHRDSAWRASLLVNLGEVYERTGYARRALDAWNDAWTVTKDATDVYGRAVADRALAEWLTLTFGRGDVDATRRRLRETASREIGGSAEGTVRNVRERLSILEHAPHLLVPAEQQALARLAAYEQKVSGRSLKSNGSPTRARLSATRGQRHSSPPRRSWASTLRRALGLGLSLRPAVKTAAGRLLPRSLVHLRTGHAVAVLDAQADRLLVYDPLLGDDRWIAAAALEEDASGAALIAAGPLPDGWQPASAAMILFVTQMCPAGPPNDNDAPPCNCGGAAGPAGGGGGGGNGDGNPPLPPGPPGDDAGSTEPSSECGTGPCDTVGNALAAYRFHRLTAGLLVEDTPVGHKPPRGPAVFFHVRYNQRAGFFPQILSFSNLGSKWTHDWLSYVEDLPVACGSGGAGGNCIPAHARVTLRGGGYERHIPSGSTTYYRHWRSASELVRVSSTPLRFERRLRDGSVEVFGLSDGAPPSQGPRVFLTEIIDPRGQSVQLTYDSQFRLVSITDALAQVTTLSYELPSSPLKITKVTDPFGRFATFTYTASGELASITDVIGLTSSFVYAGDFLTRLITPYGATTFRKETDWQNDAFVRHVEAIDPLGGIERIEYRTELTTLPDSVPTAQVPNGFSNFNGALDQFVSLYWDKRAMAVAPRDPASAVITSWLTENLFNKQWVGVNVPRYLKRPIEGRIWFAYPEQNPLTGEVGTWIKPSRVARVLDDGTSQIWETTYNTHGMVTSRTDPLGRRTSLTYAANEIDLLEVRQTTETTNDLLTSYGSYGARRRPQTMTDEAGQTSTATYSAHGQLLTTTNAKSETTTYTYDANGFLLTMTGPVTGATTTYTYDGYGRLRTVTDSDSYTLTADYDALDRVTRITYPDGTFQEMTYDKLDAVSVRDRAGRETRRVYDPLRRVITKRDPLGRTETQQWCGCGSLDAFIDAKGQKTSWLRDAQGRVLSEIRDDGVAARTLVYENTTSRIKSTTDANGQVTTYTYALDDAVLSVVYTAGSVATPSVTFTYDSVYARMTGITDGTGATAYAYHAPGGLGGGHLASADGPLADDLVTYTYDEFGRDATQSVNGAATVTTYDALGRITAKQHPLGTFTYTYDGLSSRVATVSYPNGQTSGYTYAGATADHRLQIIHHKKPGGATSSRFDYTYDAVGNVQTWQQQRESDPAVLWRYTYDRADQLQTAVKWSTAATPTVLKRHAYGYDLAGNRITEQIDDVAIESTFDRLNRLVQQRGGGLVRFAGTLSEAATLTVQGRPAQVAPDNSFNGTAPVAQGTTVVTLQATDASGNVGSASYQVDQSAPQTLFSFDANGNITSDGTRTYVWDAENRLVSVSDGTGTLATYAYDSAGRRVQRIVGTTTMQYVYNGLNVAQERVTSGAWHHYVQGSGLDRPLAVGTGSTVEAYFVGDHLGSISAQTDGSGTVVHYTTYAPFGAIESGGGDLAFGGRAADAEMAWYYLRARYYVPALGRFASVDPLGLKMGANTYTYVFSRPTVFTDPSGLGPGVIQFPGNPNPPGGGLGQVRQVCPFDGPQQPRIMDKNKIGRAGLRTVATMFLAAVNVKVWRCVIFEGYCGSQDQLSFCGCMLAASPSDGCAWATGCQPARCENCDKNKNK